MLISSKFPNRFQSPDNFVRQSVDRYDLNLITVCGTDYKLALESLKQKSKIKAIFMGTRTSDMPNHVVLNELQMTDPDWPQFMRISPMLKWSYSQVWSFIRGNDVLYCSLYDRGYILLFHVFKGSNLANMRFSDTHQSVRQGIQLQIRY